MRPWLAMFGHGVREGQQRGIYRAGLDPDAYFRHMLQLIVVGIGTSEVLADPSSRGAREEAQRRHRELLPIARTTLLNDATAPRLRKDRSQQGDGRVRPRAPSPGPRARGGSTSLQ